jgi:integrase
MMPTNDPRKDAEIRAALLKSLAGRWPLAAADPLWISHSPDGQPTSHALTTGGLRMLMVKLRRETGIAVTAHMFRRTFALWALQSGMDVFSLQMLMGHADLQVLRVYLDQKPGDLELAHRRFGPVDTML